MSIDKQGKSGLNTPTTRPSENKPGSVTQTVNDTKDKVKKILERK